ncbi:MAG: hypothetical protein R6V10_02345 [bacterium]
MKRGLITSSLLCLIALLALGCPTATTDVNKQERLSLNQEDTEKVITNTMSELGYNVKVKVKDFDENGKEDIGIEHLSGKESKELVIFLAHITGAVGSMEKHFTWNSDKVIVLRGENLYVADISDCRRCSEMIEDDASAEKVSNCLLETWWVIEGQEALPEKKKQLDKEQIF